MVRGKFVVAVRSFCISRFTGLERLQHCRNRKASRLNRSKWIYLRHSNCQFRPTNLVVLSNAWHSMHWIVSIGFQVVGYWVTQFGCQQVVSAEGRESKTCLSPVALRPPVKALQISLDTPQLSEYYENSKFEIFYYFYLNSSSNAALIGLRLLQL